jgi:hypothetical protein
MINLLRPSLCISILSLPSLSENRAANVSNPNPIPIHFCRDRFLLAHARSARKFGIARNKAARRKLAKRAKKARKPRTPKRAQIRRKKASRKNAPRRRQDGNRRRNRNRRNGNKKRRNGNRNRRNRNRRNVNRRRKGKASRAPRNGRVITSPSRIRGSKLPARHIFRDTTVDPVATRARFGLGAVPEFPAMKPINSLASDLPDAGAPRSGLPRKLERGMRGSRDLLKARWTESPEVLSPDRAYSVDRRRISTDRLGPDGRPNDLRMIPGSPDTAPTLPTFLATSAASTASAPAAPVDIPAKPLSLDDDLTSPYKAKVTADDAMGPTNVDSAPDSIGSAPDAPKSDKADRL